MSKVSEITKKLVGEKFETLEEYIRDSAKLIIFVLRILYMV